MSGLVLRARWVSRDRGYGCCDKARICQEREEKKVPVSQMKEYAKRVSSFRMLFESNVEISDGEDRREAKERHVER